MVTFEEVAQALTRLAETDQPCADLKADVVRSDKKAKSIHSAIFLRQQGTVKEREAIADNSPDYQDALEDHFKAIELYEGVRNERSRQELVIEVWRSINAARNRGQIV